MKFYVFLWFVNLFIDRKRVKGRIDDAKDMNLIKEVIGTDLETCFVTSKRNQ